MKTCMFLCFHINLKHESIRFHVNFPFSAYFNIIMIKGLDITSAQFEFKSTPKTENLINNMIRSKVYSRTLIKI